MTRSPEDVAKSFYAALCRDDFAASLACFADNATFCQHVPKETLPSAGEWRGKDQLAKRLAQVYTDWEPMSFEPSRLFIDGAQVECIVTVHFRWRRTGDIYEGSIRHVFDIVHGRIHRLDEYLDVAMIDAFMRLIRSRPESRSGKTDG